MIFLSDLGFEAGLIATIQDNFPETTLELIKRNEKMVAQNISFLINLGVTNYQEAFIKFHSMFLLEPAIFEEIFNKYDTEDLINKLAKNVAITEYL